MAIFIIITACNHSAPASTNSTISANDSINLIISDNKDVNDITDTPGIDLQGSEMMDLFVVVSDTSYNYYQLRNDIVKTSKKFNILIDTMGRFYDPVKNKIKLPDNDEDEIYAGEYFPRRYESDELSVEYASQYIDRSNDSLMAGIMGIFAKKEDAESRLKKIKSLNPRAFLIKASLFQGCMH